MLQQKETERRQLQDEVERLQDQVEMLRVEAENEEVEKLEAQEPDRWEFIKMWSKISYQVAKMTRCWRYRSIVRLKFLRNRIPFSKRTNKN